MVRLILMYFVLKSLLQNGMVFHFKLKHISSWAEELSLKSFVVVIVVFAVVAVSSSSSFLSLQKKNVQTDINFIESFFVLKWVTPISFEVPLTPHILHHGGIF